MKKLLSALAVLTVCTMLTACGNDNDGTASVNTASTTEISAAEGTAEETTTELTEGTSPEETTTSVAETTSEAITTEETSVATAVTPEETTAEATVETVTEAEGEVVDEEEIVIDDSVDDEPVKSNFDSFDDFLCADIFSLDGKTVTADKCLSASMLDTLDKNFYLEITEFDGGSPFRLAIKDDMTMLEQKIEDRTEKMIIRDSKAYTFDHEKKVALFLPADEEFVAHYTPEGLGIITKNINKEKFVIADVTINGTSYKFEYCTDAGWAMLYDTDGKLYAYVDDGNSLEYSLHKFSLTNKIPSDTFDIPEDYFQLDLVEMMKNAPPPEEAE